MLGSSHSSSFAKSLDPEPIIEVGVMCALAQLLDHGFYHGDPVSSIQHTHTHTQDESKTKLLSESLKMKVCL